MAHEIDETIHQKTRLAIMAHLVAVLEADFLALKDALNLTDGNLSVHAGLLETKGLIETEKSFVGKKTRTTYRVTPAGRKAFEEYLGELEKVLRGGTGRLK
ncbi:MAG: transcriptional regulator [Armatimonadetes bacterium]|nr:transcriptional regulator [Armatimonadota bacterium]